MELRGQYYLVPDLNKTYRMASSPESVINSMEEYPLVSFVSIEAAMSSRNSSCWHSSVGLVWLGRNKERGLGPIYLKNRSAALSLQEISVPYGTGKNFVCVSLSSSACQELDPKALRSYADDTRVEQEQPELGFLDSAPSTAPQYTRLPPGRQPMVHRLSIDVLIFF